MTDNESLDNNAKNSEPIKKANSQELKELAIYLSGIVKGQGNLQPLGTIHLDNLWLALSEIRDREKEEHQNTI